MTSDESMTFWCLLGKMEPYLPVWETVRVGARYSD